MRGATLKMRLSGKYTCTNTAGLTLRLRAYLDTVAAGNLLFDSGAIALGTARTNYSWTADVRMGTFLTGAAGSITISDGVLMVENAARSFNQGLAGSFGTLDLTAGHAIVWTAQWSLAEPGDSITMNWGELGFTMPGAQPAF